MSCCELIIEEPIIRRLKVRLDASIILTLWLSMRMLVTYALAKRDFAMVACIIARVFCDRLSRHLHQLANFGCIIGWPEAFRVERPAIIILKLLCSA